MLANLPKIEILVHDKNPDIICLSETRIDSAVYAGEYDIDAYKSYMCLSDSRHSGGVCMYVKANIKSSFVHSCSYGYNSFLLVDVINGEFRGRWCVIYRSPSTPAEPFIDKLEEICHQYSVGGPFTVIGDFNVNCHRSVSNSIKFNLINRMSAQGLIQKVRKFTRIAQGSKSLIDLCFTNNPTMSVDVINDHKISDHKTLCIAKKIVRKQRMIKVIIDRSAYKPELLQEKLRSQFNMSALASMNTEQRATFFQDSLRTTMASFVKQREICVDHSKKWYSSELLDLRRKRNVAERKAGFTDSTNYWADYRRLRNAYNKLCHKFKSNYIKRTVITNSDDPKKLWRQLKRYQNGGDDKIDYVIFNGSKFESPEVCAKLFNDYFIDSVAEISSAIPDVPYVNSIEARIITEWENFEPLDRVILKSIIKKIKSKGGIDNVNIDIMNDATDTMAQQFIEIVNDSFSAGFCPKIWKQTVVTPIQKISGTNELTQFRPVNNIMPDIKIVEKHLKTRLEKHLELNSILCKNQSAYRPFHSCETSFNLVLNEWKTELDKGNKIIVVFLDLKRAFETVSRPILLKKLDKYGVKGQVLQWFSSWLQDRTQCTMFNGAKSEWREVDIGIPQGTPLSCILFLIYINDLVNKLNKCHINLFADDAVIWLSGKDLSSMAPVINSELSDAAGYMIMNKLDINVDKTKYMVFGQMFCDISVIISNRALERVAVLKYLGLMVDDKLNFKENTVNVLKKVGRKVNWLKRMRKKIDRNTKLLLYNALILPHFDYCSTILFLTTKEDLNSMQKLQNQAMRAILNESIYAHIDDMLDILGILSVNQRICFNVLIVLYKAKMGLLPQYICEKLINVNDAQPYPLRSNHLYRVPPASTRAAANSLYVKGLNLLNDFLKCLTQNESENSMSSINMLKKNVSNFVKSKIERR